jgi:hypothetical protein
MKLQASESVADGEKVHGWAAIQSEDDEQTHIKRVCGSSRISQ